MAMNRWPEPSGESAVQRLVPHEPFPSYSYVTGRFPHPTREVLGHSYGLAPRAIAPPDAKHWRDCHEYLYGIDLFNYGYYWEAHEAWEGVWHACGRHGITADFLKGLIKLAAAGVKAREQRTAGVRTHAQRAAELFAQVHAQLSGEAVRYFGLLLAPLETVALQLASGEVATLPLTGAAVEIVLPFSLMVDTSAQ